VTDERASGFASNSKKVARKLLERHRRRSVTSAWAKRRKETGTSGPKTAARLLTVTRVLAADLRARQRRKVSTACPLAIGEDRRSTVRELHRAILEFSKTRVSRVLTERLNTAPSLVREVRSKIARGRTEKPSLRSCSGLSLGTGQQRRQRVFEKIVTAARRSDDTETIEKKKKKQKKCRQRRTES